MKTKLQTMGTLWASALLLLAPIGAAHAGAWVVDSYEYSQKSQHETQSFNQGGGSPIAGVTFQGWYRTIQIENKSGIYKPNLERRYRVESSISLIKDTYCIEGPWNYLPGEATASLTITPIFRWEPNRIYDDDNPDGAPDPNDLPPQKLWYYEIGEAGIGHFIDSNHRNQPSYSGNLFSVEELENGFGKEARQFRNHQTDTWLHEASESRVIEKDTGSSSTVRGETRTLSARVIPTAEGLYSERKDEYHVAGATLIYEVDTVSFDVFSRIKADHDSTDLYTDLRASGYYPGSSASIAAGGQETQNHEHEADIVMRIKRQRGNWGYGTPLPNVPRSILPRLRVSNREGVKIPVKSYDLNTGKTDSDGRVMANHLFSRDLESHGGAGGEVGVYPSNVPYVYNRIGMSWGEVEWRMGQDGDKQWNTRFLLLGGDYSEWAWVKVKNYDDKPLLDHTMKLIVDRLQVRETNSETGAVKTTLYTTNKTEADQYSNNGDDDEGGEPSFRVVYAKDLTGDVSRFITLPGEMSDSGQGVYKGEFTVRKVANVTIDKLNLALEDQGVYRPEY